MIQIGVESPVYGAGVRLGPIPLGLYFAGGESEVGARDLGEGYGLRGGDFGKYHSQALVYTFLGGENFYSGEPLRTDEKKIIIDKHGIALTADERAKITVLGALTLYLDFINLFLIILRFTGGSRRD